MKLKITIVTCLLLLFTVSVNAQKKKPKTYPLTGQNIGCTFGAGYGKHFFGEAGITLTNVHEDFAFVWHMFTLSAELDAVKEPIPRIKLNYWRSNDFIPVSYGISLVQYLSSKDPALSVQPELGVGWEKFRAYIAYRLKALGAKPEGSSGFVIGATYRFDVIHTKVKRK